MTNNPACCMPDSSLQEVARLMVENDCGCIPVVDSQLGMKPIGTITDRDITVRTVASGQNPLEMKASDIMSIDIATIKPSASLEECFDVMEEKEIRRILVVDEQGRCCGIVAQADVAQVSANPARTGRFLREISDSPASRTMTMSRDYDNNRSYLNINSVLPILLGIGSVTALMYYFGQRRSNRGEGDNYQTEAHLSMPVHESAVHPYVDASNEVSRRQRNLENRVQAIKSEIESVAETPETAETSAPAGGRFELKETAAG
jgi:CBS domain-containing protein